MKFFGFIKESIAANRIATAQATGAAMCPEVYQLPRAEGGQDLSPNEAHRAVMLVSLGKKSILFRHGNDAGERTGAIEELAAMLKKARDRRGLARVPFAQQICACIAGAALYELAVDKCFACNAAGEVPDHDVKQLEGRQPMRVCPSCMGARRRRHTEDERIQCLAKEWVQAFPAQRVDDPEAVTIVAKSLRNHARLRELLLGIDYAKGILLEAERVATENTARMVEKWTE